MTRHGFDVQGSTTIYRGAIAALRSDQVEMPGGRSATREVIEHFGAVAVAALDDEDRLVVVEQYRHPVRRRLYELPAGLLDVGGEDPAVTAARELVEEAGLAAAEWSVLLDLVPSPGISDESVRVYLACGLSGVPRPEPGDDEEADLRVTRLPLDEALRGVFSGELVNGATVAAVLAVHAVRAGAAEPRPLDAPWTDRPTALARRVAEDGAGRG